MGGDWGSMSGLSMRLASLTNLSRASSAQPVTVPAALQPVKTLPERAIAQVPAVNLSLPALQAGEDAKSVLTPALTRLMGGLHRGSADATAATATALQTLAPVLDAAAGDPGIDGVRLRVGNYRMSFGDTGTVDMLVVEAGLSRKGEVAPEAVSLMTLDGRPLPLSTAQIGDGIGTARYRSTDSIPDSANDSASKRLRDAQTLLASLA